MKRVLLLLIFLFLSTYSLIAIDELLMEIESGVTWLHNEAYKGNNVLDKDPDPILYRLGLAFPIYFDNSLFLRPSLSIISNSWEYRSDNSWAMPVDLMWQDLLVMSLLLDVTIGYQFNFKPFSLALFIGPAFNFRIPLWGDDEAVRDDMAKYFYSELRFVNISGGFFFLIPITNTIGFTVKGDSWLPIYNIWTSNRLPFSDGLMVTLNIGLRFTL